MNKCVFRARKFLNADRSVNISHIYSHYYGRIRKGNIFVILQHMLLQKLRKLNAMFLQKKTQHVFSRAFCFQMLLWYPAVHDCARKSSPLIPTSTTVI